MSDSNILNIDEQPDDLKKSPLNSSFAVPAWFRYLAYFMLAVIVAASVVFAVKSYQNAPNALIEVNAEGLSSKEYQLLKQAVGTTADGSYFDADLQALRDIVLSQSWVDEVSVVRDWQRGIVITALPKRPVAKFGTERLVDAKGEVFVPADENLLQSNSLITLQGSKSQAPVVMQQMQQINEWFAPLNIKVVDLILTPRMTWLVRFDDGLRVIVDNENTAQKLIGLSHMLNNQLKSKRADIQAVDLRYKNGFAISWKIDSVSHQLAVARNKAKATTALELATETETHSEIEADRQH